jgi:hypothetical protein
MTIPHFPHIWLIKGVFNKNNTRGATNEAGTPCLSKTSELISVCVGLFCCIFDCLCGILSTIVCLYPLGHRIDCASKYDFWLYLSYSETFLICYAWFLANIPQKTCRNSRNYYPDSETFSIFSKMLYT